MKFLVVAVNYFTKWVEAQPFAHITKEQMRKFMWSSIIYRFRIPRILISDNGRQFDNNWFKDFCVEQRIQHHFSSPTYPQANEQVEVTN